MKDVITLFLFMAGMGQVVMMAAVLPLPRWLNWRGEIAKLSRLNGQVFWIYAAYIFATNIAIGLFTVFFAPELTEGGPMVTALTGFMFLYWLARLVLQVFVIDKAAAPKGIFFFVGEKLLMFLFVFFTGTYAWAWIFNLVH